jgi:hypothetical protein
MRGASRVYILATHIPIYTSDGRSYLPNSWFRDVLLARDWLAAPFGGRLVLIAPSEPATDELGQLDLVDSSLGIEAVSGMDNRCRARSFWFAERKRWSATVARYLPGAQVLHTAISDLYRPMQQLAFAAAHRAGIGTVLIGPDMDPHEALADRLRSEAGVRRAGLSLYLNAFDLTYQFQLKRADLALLKEGAIYDRYARFAKHPKAFCHSMYGVGDVIPEEAL